MDVQPARPRFSDTIAAWLKSDKPKTIAGLEAVFGRKSFPIAIVLLMALPATPIPTGGISHLLEIITMILALEMAAGFNRFWLPRRWRNGTLPARITGRAIPLVLKIIRRFESWSSPRGRWIFHHATTQRLAGLLLFIFALAAFVAIPFSGMDTLPAVGAVMLSLSLIVEDVVLLILGLLAGGAGIGLVITFGSLAFNLIKHYL